MRPSPVSINSRMDSRVSPLPLTRRGSRDHFRPRAGASWQEAHLRSVSQVSVIGLPSEKWGEVVHAVVILAEGVSIDSDELIAHCRRYLAGYKCPRGITFRGEPMPLSPANKILKSELRKQVLGKPWLNDLRSGCRIGDALHGSPRRRRWAWDNLNQRVLTEMTGCDIPHQRLPWELGGTTQAISPPRRPVTERTLAVT